MLHRRGTESAAVRPLFALPATFCSSQVKANMASGLLGQLRCLHCKPSTYSLKARQPPLPARRKHVSAALPDDDFESTSEDVQSLPVAESSGRLSQDGNRTEALIKSLQGERVFHTKQFAPRVNLILHTC